MRMCVTVYSCRSSNCYVRWRWVLAVLVLKWRTIPNKWARNVVFITLRKMPVQHATRNGATSSRSETIYDKSWQVIDGERDKLDVVALSKFYRHLVVTKWDNRIEIRVLLIRRRRLKHKPVNSVAKPHSGNYFDQTNTDYSILLSSSSWYKMHLGPLSR